MQVRTLHLSDFLKLGQMHQADVGLNLPYALVVPDLPLPAAFTQHLPINSLNSSVYVYEDEGRPQAFSQARARQRRDEWEVLALGTVGNFQPPPPLETLPAPQSDDTAGDGSSVVTQVLVEPRLTKIDEIELAWLKLLEYLVVDAGEKGVVRVYARLSADSPQLDLFNQTGFHAYTHETLFHLAYTQPIDRPAALGLRLKEQRNRDTWYVQQLYSAITPSYVQNSEHNTSRSWELHRTYLPRPTKEYGWLLMESDKAAAYIRILSYRNRHLLRIMNLNARRELLPDLIRYALSTLKVGSDTQIYCAVREYQLEQESILEDAGFVRILGKQAVLIKHTVQYIRATERQLIRGRESKLELAHRVIQPDC